VPAPTVSGLAIVLITLGALVLANLVSLGESPPDVDRDNDAGRLTNLGVRIGPNRNLARQTRTAELRHHQVSEIAR
jgi:hypothetical protein